jgi:hypothetical protein
MAHFVRLMEYAPEITLIFCLRHHCIKNQVLQVFGRIEQRFNGSEVLQVSPPIFFPSLRIFQLCFGFVGCLKTSRGKILEEKNIVKSRCSIQLSATINKRGHARTNRLLTQHIASGFAFRIL